MRTWAWIGIGWLGVTLCTAVAARVGLSHVMPDMAVVLLVFLAMRREPIPLAFTGMVLGYLVGRQALAPVGLHEIALVLCSVGVYLAAGHLSGSGALFFALTSGVAVVAYHLIIFGLLLWQRGHAGFSSWATALLLPSALATAFVALLCHGPMVWLERRLTQDKREGLAWR